MATGGSADRFYELFRDVLHVDVFREDELVYLIEGLKFTMLIPDELIQSVSHPTPSIPPGVPMLSPSHHTLVHSHRTTANRPKTSDHPTTANHPISAQRTTFPVRPLPIS